MLDVSPPATIKRVNPFAFRAAAKGGKQLFHPFAAGLVAILRLDPLQRLRLGGGIDHRRQRRITRCASTQSVSVLT